MPPCFAPGKKGTFPIVLVVGALFALTATTASAGQCEIPLFIKQGMASANVMILADNSLSMDEIMYDDRYDPDVVYAGNFSTDATYYVRSSGRYTPSSFNRRWPTTPSANLVASNYVGNYMNFIFFALDDVQRLTIPTSTRIEVLREVLTDLVDRSEQLKFGMTEFDGEDLFFGLVDGFEKELGYFSLSELASVKGACGIGIERDKWFDPTPLSKLK